MLAAAAELEKAGSCIEMFQMDVILHLRASIRTRD